MPIPRDDHGLVAHRRDVGAAGGRRAHHERHLRNPGGRHPGLVVEDPAEVIAVGEDVGLERQERAAAVDEVDARQPVLERDLLGPEVLLDRHRVVGPALDRRVVADDDDARALDRPDPGDDAGARGLVVVQAVGGERAQLEERRAWVQQPVDPLPDGQLAPLAMPGDRAVVAAGAPAGDLRLALAEVRDERRHRVVVGADLGAGGIEPAPEDGHGADHRSEPVGRNRRRGGHAELPTPCVPSRPPAHRPPGRRLCQRADARPRRRRRRPPNPRRRTVRAHRLTSRTRPRRSTASRSRSRRSAVTASRAPVTRRSRSSRTAEPTRSSRSRRSSAPSPSRSWRRSSSRSSRPTSRRSRASPSPTPARSRSTASSSSTRSGS